MSRGRERRPKGIKCFYFWPNDILLPFMYRSGEVVVVGGNISYVIPSAVLAEAAKDSSRNVIKLSLEQPLPPTPVDDINKVDETEIHRDHIYDSCN